MITNKSRQVLRLRDVKSRTGKSTSGIYADMASGKFPKPFPLGARAVGWLESEIDSWIEARIAARDQVAA